MNQALPALPWAAAARRHLALALLGSGLSLGTGAALAADTSVAAELQRWQQAAGAPASAERGRSFFTSRHGGEWSCASCHRNPPTSDGQHASTGKRLAPLAPAFNPQAFTEQAKVDKWLRRNCKDVVGRECSPGEKADVLAWLASLK